MGRINDQALFRFNKLDARRLKQQQSNEVVILSTEVEPCGLPNLESTD